MDHPLLALMVSCGIESLAMGEVTIRYEYRRGIFDITWGKDQSKGMMSLVLETASPMELDLVYHISGLRL